CDVILEELFDTYLADEAYPLTVLLAGRGKTQFLGDSPDLVLGLELTYREQGFFKRLLGHAVQEISLVLIDVPGRQQPAVIGTGIVAGGYQVGAVLQGSIQEKSELDLLITHDVRV